MLGRTHPVGGGSRWFLFDRSGRSLPLSKALIDLVGHGLHSTRSNDHDCCRSQPRDWSADHHPERLCRRSIVGVLRNVGANYPFEKSRRLPAIQPNLVTGDGSRLSCGVADYGQYSILDSTRYRRGSRRLMLTMGLPRLRYSPILFLTMIGIHDQFPPNRTLGLIVLGVVLWW
jgi:hypothetical protein